jgi:hypothetical protein
MVDLAFKYCKEQEAKESKERCAQEEAAYEDWQRANGYLDLTPKTPKRRKIAVVAPNNSRSSTPVPSMIDSLSRARTQHEIGQALRRYVERADHDQSKCICGRPKRKQFKQCGICYRNGNCQVSKGKCKSCNGPCGPLFMYCGNCSSDMYMK